MLVRIDSPPGFAAVDPLMRPRLWATAWSVGLGSANLAPSTVRLQLRHIDKLYTFCDESFGSDSLDEAISTGDATATQVLLDCFAIELTSDPDYTTTQVQCWSAVCSFVHAIALRRATQEDAWLSLCAYLRATRKLRSPSTSRFRFVRALPDVTLAGLLRVAHPDAAENPFISAAARMRNWLAVNLLLLCGLRRGELLLLSVDALKHDVDAATGKVMHWLNVTTSDEEEDARSTRPSIKTVESHRQIPVSEALALLYTQYVEEARIDAGEHGFLFTARTGSPLSAESVNLMLQRLTGSLDPESLARFHDRCGNKRYISPHDLRHTCASARFGLFMKADSNRELALQRMRSFFGWSRTSDMPEVYARAAIQDDLVRGWNQLFEQRIHQLRTRMQ